GWIDDRATRREAEGLRRGVRPRRADQLVLDLAGNDYLGLVRHPLVVEGGVDALRTWGAGSTGSRLVTGSTTLHAALEDALAAHLGAGAALVFSSGYTANLGAVTSLAGPGDLVVSDARNHASLIDACRLSRAEVVVTAHADPAAVDAALSAGTYRRALIVTDAVFSVDGDLAPLARLHEVARRHGAVLVVDEAHSFGIVGPHGRGALAAAGLAGDPDVVGTGTLSKALGSQGGFVFGSAALRAHVLDAARTFIFDTGLAPACAGSALAALELLRGHPELPIQALAHARALAGIAASLVGSPAGSPVVGSQPGPSDPGTGRGPDSGGSPDSAAAPDSAGAPARTMVPASAVVPVILGDPRRAVAAAATCAAHGVAVGCFRPPSVPPGTSRLRLAARADLTDADLALAADALSAALRG
ncbi:MAG: 8-amino-7-oxononanoate synthase, partial [Frankia sp.]